MDKPLKFSIWFSVIITAVFIVAWLWVQEYSAPGPYDLEPVNIVRNGSGNLPRDEVLRGWQTYRNEEYGFEVKYPARYSLKRVPDGERRGALDMFYLTTEGYGHANNVRVGIYAIDDFALYNGISGYTLSYNATSNQWKIATEPQMGFYSWMCPAQETLGNGRPAFSFSVGDAGFSRTTKFLINKTKGKIVSFSHEEMEWQVPYITREEFSNILSSFRAIEAGDEFATIVKCPAASLIPGTENWQTYRNEEYGFELKYPPGWEVLNNSAGVNVGIRDKKYSGSIEWPGLRIDDKDIIGEFKTSRVGSEFNSGDIKNDVARLRFINGGKVLYASCALYFNSDLIPTCNQILSTFKFLK